MRAKIHGKSLAARLRDGDTDAIAAAQRRSKRLHEEMGEIPMSRAELDE